MIHLLFYISHLIISKTIHFLYLNMQMLPIFNRKLHFNDIASSNITLFVHNNKEPFDPSSSYLSTKLHQKVRCIFIFVYLVQVFVSNNDLYMIPVPQRCLLVYLSQQVYHPRRRLQDLNQLSGLLF